jgi:hypothetical protein
MPWAPCNHPRNPPHESAPASKTRAAKAAADLDAARVANAAADMEAARVDNAAADIAAVHERRPVLIEQQPLPTAIASPKKQQS